MNKYGLVAIDAVSLCKQSPSMGPVEAWDVAATKHFSGKTAAQEKCCPKGAFLGLCEEGLVSGIRRGNYTGSRKNKQYAIDAVKVLQSNPSLADDAMVLWRDVLRGVKKQHNSQMHVVIALLNEGLLKSEI